MTGAAEPWVIHEDDDLLVVAKPAGVTTHRADTHTQDGMHEWVQRQRPGTSLSVLHRLDKATSGVLLFGKTTAANRAVGSQLEGRTVEKSYELVTLARGGPRSLRCDTAVDGASAVTDLLRQARGPGAQRYEARPHSGRTHQVRIHAEASGLPVAGDVDHGGPEAARVFLHAAGLRLRHPDDSTLHVAAPRPRTFDLLLDGTHGPTSPALRAIVAHEARALLLDPSATDAYVWIDRDHDGFPGVRVERLGDVALVHDRRDGEAPIPSEWLDALHAPLDLRSVYVQRQPRGGGGGLPVRMTGTASPHFEVTELGLRYGIDLEASTTSTGLFLDQRETRRELLAHDLAGLTVLNAFAHTGALSVAAARAGAETLTLDLSKRYLDWARDNLRRNALDPADHDFLYGDALEWMERLAKKGRRFDVVLVDPPSSSTARKKGSGRWSVDRDLGALVERAARLGTEGGRVFVSTNLRRMTWAGFLDHLDDGLAGAGRTGTVTTRTLPLDHRSGPGDPPYLKAAWIALDR